MKVVRGDSNSRYERNRIRGLVIIISTVFAYFVSSSLFERLIYISRSRVVQMPIKGGGFRITGETLMSITEVHDEVDMPRSVGEIRSQLRCQSRSPHL